MELLPHLLEHAFEDTIYLVPFLLATYILLELLEHKAGDKAAGEGKGLSPQVRRVRQDRPDRPANGVPLLLQMRRISLLLPGSHKQPHSLHRVSGIQKISDKFS